MLQKNRVFLFAPRKATVGIAKFDFEEVREILK